jgi:hypothetical protein
VILGFDNDDKRCGFWYTAGGGGRRVEELIWVHSGEHGLYRNEEVDIAVRKWFRMQDPDLHQEGTFTNVSRREKSKYAG